MAGRPGAARAAGRALRAAAAANGVPWHRVVRADGGQWHPEQLARLQREGARPRPDEPLAAWAQRVGASRIGRWRDRRLAAANDPQARRWPTATVEAFADAAAAQARGFTADGQPPPPLWPEPPARRPRAGRVRSIEDRLRAIDDARVAAHLEADGLWHRPRLLAAAECADLLQHASTRRFERTIDMRAKGYGVGTYHYFSEPLHDLLQGVRRELYHLLRPIAEDWRAAVGDPYRYPATLTGFWRQCRAAGQRRASSIVLCYPQGGVNHLHRDVYGPIWFAFQALLVLGRRDTDFTGGDFVLQEERPGEAPRRRVQPLSQGDLAVFASSFRLDRSGPKPRRVPLRHGTTPITHGRRQAMGLVFHLAE